MKGLFISGSGTDVGKTFIASRLIHALNYKYRVVARKPIESDCTKTSQGLVPKDAVLLNDACTSPDPIESVCAYQFEACVSGEKASTDQGVEVVLDDLVSASRPINTSDFVIVEGAGGLYSPIAAQVLNVDLAAALGLPVVIVVRDELGAINQALLSLRAAKSSNLNVIMLVLNQMSANNLNNAQAIQAYTDARVVVFNKDNEDGFVKKILELVE
ncbi:MAG: dethiobiotin synthase [Gammaproteobacteria bacterium]|jgi:dethiobiotin synthetase|nr:dethiobiotin synthase [Gammaproteobacteria bacterium]